MSMAVFEVAPELTRVRVACRAGRTCRLAEHSPEAVMTAAILTVKLTLVSVAVRALSSVLPYRICSG